MIHGTLLPGELLGCSEVTFLRTCVSYSLLSEPMYFSTIGMVGPEDYFHTVGLFWEALKKDLFCRLDMRDFLLCILEKESGLQKLGLSAVL